MPRDLGLSLVNAAPAPSSGARPLGINLSAASPPDVSGTESFLRGGAQGATLGFGDELEGLIQAAGRKYLPDALGGGSAADATRSVTDLYREGRDVARRENDAAEEAHPALYTAGDVAGGLITTPLLPGGGAAVEAEALAKAGLTQAAKKVALRAAVKTGAELGAASGLGTSRADLTRGDVAGAAADTLKGGVFGGAAGGAGEIVGSKIGAAAEGVRDWLQDLAPRKAVNALRGTAEEVKALVRTKQLEPLGDWLLRNKIVEAGDTFDDVLTKATGVQKGAGKALEGVLAELDATGAVIPKQKLADAFMDLATQAEGRGPGAAPLVRKYTAEAEAVMKRPEQNITFSQAEEWKRGFQDRVNYGKKNPSALQQGDQELANASRQLVEDEAEKAAQASGSDVADRFMQAKNAYGYASKAADMAEGALGRQEARNIASPSDKYAGGAALVAGLLTGHPLAGAAGAVVVGAANKLVRDRAASTTAVAAQSLSQRVAQIAQTSPRKLGAYGAVLAGALQRGGQSAFDAHMYVLGQTDPKFQELTKKLSEEHSQ